LDHRQLRNANRRLVNNTALSGLSAECRAALLAEWTAGLEQMRGHPPPLGFSEADWHQFKRDGLALLAEHGPRLARLGWTTLDLFGLHDTRPGVRVSHSGLARFLHGDAIAELTERHARIRRRTTGSVLTFYRSPAQPGAVPAWDLHHPQQTDARPIATHTEATSAAKAAISSSKGDRYARLLVPRR
jgi:hypothetical protein